MCIACGYVIRRGSGTVRGVREACGREVASRSRALALARALTVTLAMSLTLAWWAGNQAELGYRNPYPLILALIQAWPWPWPWP